MDEGVNRDQDDRKMAYQGGFLGWGSATFAALGTAKRKGEEVWSNSVRQSEGGDGVHSQRFRGEGKGEGACHATAQPWATLRDR